MCVWSSHTAEYGSTGRSCSWSAEQAKCFFPLTPFAPENLILRDRFDSSVPRQSANFHTQAEFGAYLWDPSQVPRRRPFIYFKPPYAIGSVPSFSGHAIAYRWRLLPRVRRHRASKPRCSFKRVLPGQDTMDRPINMRLSFRHPLLVWSGHGESTGGCIELDLL